MSLEEKLTELKKWEFKKSAYELLMSTAYFDDETIAPKGGQAYRYERLALMSGEIYKISSDPKIKALLYELKDEQIDEVTRRKVKLLLKSFEDLEKIPQEVYEQFTKLSLESQSAWAKAKSANDYGIFKPYLLKIIAYQKKMALYRRPDSDPYETMLDDYEEGMDKKSYDEFFALIKKELLPLIKAIMKKAAIKDDFIHAYYPKDKQALLMNDINKLLGFDGSWGYMGVSLHPFTSGFSNNDVRVTTSYDEYNISSAIYSIIHEVGHAFYEHQMDESFEGTILKNVSSGMHESQSRFLENYIGRKKSFIKNYYPKLVSLFKENLEDVSLNEFYKAINIAKPSLIRTDADELTYPIHILIRYEIEKGIFDESIDIENLDKVWNQYYKEYLGVDVTGDDVGILQDIHWSSGSFGYFPTYALGSALAAQILHYMEKEKDVETLLEKGDLKAITDYLKDKIHRYGALYDLDTLLEKSFGERFNPRYYIDYLKDKYMALYDLKNDELK